MRADKEALAAAPLLRRATGAAQCRKEVQVRLFKRGGGTPLQARGGGAERPSSSSSSRGADGLPLFVRDGGVYRTSPIGASLNLAGLEATSVRSGAGAGGGGGVHSVSSAIRSAAYMQAARRRA